MAWIESHQALGQHPKTQQLATLLRVSLPAAVGHLHFFWWWALDFAPTGAIPNATPVLVARAAQWKGPADRFWLAMIQSGFIDVNEDRVCIHDWLDYAGRLVSKRAANAARMRSARAQHVQGLPTGPYQPDQPTVPTGPDQPLPPNPPSEPTEGGAASLDRTLEVSTDETNGACCPQFAMSGRYHFKDCPNARQAALA